MSDDEPKPADTPGGEPETATAGPLEPDPDRSDQEFATAVLIAGPELPLPASGDGGPSPGAAVEALGARIEKRLEILQVLFEREIRAEATREKVVDRLHAELQEYKQDLLLNTLRPVFIDLIQLHDDIGKVVGGGAEVVPEVGRLLALMEGFQQGIEDILYRQGVEPFRVEGDAFDPRRQRAVATVATDDPGRSKTVAARIRKGFQAGDRVIRPEIVSVYAFKS